MFSIAHLHSPVLSSQDIWRGVTSGSPTQKKNNKKTKAGGFTTSSQPTRLTTCAMYGNSGGNWFITLIGWLCVQEAEAAEDAEVHILLDNPALRPPQAPATPRGQQETLNAISGFQGFQEAIPENSFLQAVPVLASAHTADEIRSPAAASTTNDADMSDMANAVESPAPISSSADGPTGGGGRARGSWCAPVQPFIPAGKSTTSNETVAQLMRNDDDATPTAVIVSTAVAPGPVGNSQLSTVAEAKPENAAGLAEFSQHEVTTAESVATTSAADTQLPECNVLPERQPTAQPALATSATDSSPAGASSPQDHSAVIGAQQAVATAEAGRQPAARPAAGSYRRVAWAPVQDPFPAAGATAAAAATADAVEAAPIPVSPHHLGANLEVAESRSEVRSEHATGCSEAAPASQLAQATYHEVDSGESQKLDPAQQFAQDPECTQGGSEAQSREEAAAAAVQMASDGMV